MAARRFVADQAFGHPPAPVAEWLGSGVPAALLTTTAGDATDDVELLDLIIWALEMLERDY